MSGHFKSSWKKESVSKDGQPIPWYTYPMIQFLERIDFLDKTVLEIGGGNSSFWWANRAGNVLTLESNQRWFEKLNKNTSFPNLEIRKVDLSNLVASFHDQLAKASIKTFDIIILDGMDRYALIPYCFDLLNEKGMIILDDTDRYDFSEHFKKHAFHKIDFYGYAPGVTLPKCTSIQFKTPGDFFKN